MIETFSQFQSQSRVEQEKDMQTLLTPFQKRTEVSKTQVSFKTILTFQKKKKKLKVKNQLQNQTSTAQKLNGETY